jgi:tRNA A37 methylthiotransferase MiaB
MDAWAALREQLKELHTHALPPGVEETVSLIELQCPATLRENAERLHRLIRGRVTVLPPDSRHVDYDVIPITLAQGCLLNCGFCRVKSGQGFEALTFAEIAEQIAGVRKLYGRDVHNYNAIFFGQHDALQAGTDTLLFAAEKVHDILGIQHSCMKGPTLFMFGSPVSFINASEVLFERLDKLPFSTYINVGLEAADCATLTELRRPVSVELVRDAFSRMLDINQRYQHVEVTANFVFNDRSSPDHFGSLLALTGSRLDPTRAKGAIYLSPMLDGTTVTDARRRDLIRRFHEVKAHNRLPTFLYLIQRL